MVVSALGVITILLKGAGPALLGRWAPAERAQRVLALVAPTVIAALVAVQVFGVDRQLRFDARLIGLGAATVALLLRAPLVVVVVCAVAATALGRALAGQFS